MRKHVLYVNKSHEDLEYIKILLQKIKNKHQIDHQVVTSDKLDETKIKVLLDQIRIASRNAEARATSSGGGMLPISRSKKLNVDKMPILLVIEEGRPINVFPQEKGPKGSRTEVIRYLEQLLEADTFQGFEKQVISEDDIWKIASNFPSIIEEGLEYRSREVEVEGGIIDIVFVDQHGNHMLVEIEIKATDAAIGQVSRFVEGYCKKNKISREKIRKAIICIEISKNVLSACKENEIEVYQFGINKRI